MKPFKFGKINKNEYGQAIIFIKYDYTKQMFFIENDGSLTFAGGEPRDYHPDFAHLSEQDFNSLVTRDYVAIKSFSAKKKYAKDVAVSPTHWYRVLSGDQRIKLVLRVKANIEEIVNDALVMNPNSKLNEYYKTLIHRSTYNDINLPELEPKDLVKLPRYDASVDKLTGTPVQFLKLIAVAYPSGRRKQKYLRSY